LVFILINGVTAQLLPLPNILLIFNSDFMTKALGLATGHYKEHFFMHNRVMQLQSAKRWRNYTDRNKLRRRILYTNI